jgi:hypothetical protein
MARPRLRPVEERPMTFGERGPMGFFADMHGRDLEHERTRPLSPDELRWLNARDDLTLSQRKTVRQQSRRARRAA